MRKLLASWMLAAIVIGTGSACPPASGAIISEVRLGRPGTDHAYVELTLTRGDGPFDWVIFDANPARANRIKSVITITPQPGKTVVLLHEGTWPALLPSKTQELALPPGALKLGGQLTGAARHLAVFQGPTGWKPGATIPSPTQWALDDLLTYRTGSWPASSDLGETIWSLSPGDAMWRFVNTDGNFTDDFSAGPVDDLGVFLNDPHTSLDPGLVNLPYATIADDPPAVTNPEPATFALLAVSASLCITRRKRVANRQGLEQRIESPGRRERRAPNG